MDDQRSDDPDDGDNNDQSDDLQRSDDAAEASPAPRSEPPRSDVVPTSPGNNDPSINDTNSNSHSHHYNTRRRRQTFEHRLDKQMNNSEHPQSYETQYTQLEDKTLRISENRDFSREDIIDALNGVDGNPNDALNYIVHFMFTQLGTTDDITDPSMFQQMNAKRGIRIFGDVAVQALVKEFIQFSDLKVFKGIDPNNLTREQKREALRALSTIKEK